MDHWVGIALWALLIVLVVLCALLWEQYDRLRVMQDMPRGFSGFMHHQSVPLTDPSAIQSWMTFDYIDHVFALPSGQLQTQLAIADARYPRLSIAAWAHASGQSDAAALGRVRAAVTGLLATSTPPQSQ